MKNIWQTITNNPKTSFTALGAGITGVLTAFSLIDTQQSLALLALFTAIGQFLGGDGKPTDK